MSNLADTLARVEDYASRHGITPQGVVRKATGDPRGFDRLAKKIGDIQAVNLWLDQNDVTSGNKDGANRHSIQVGRKDSSQGGPSSAVKGAA